MSVEIRCLYSSELRAMAGHKLTGYAAIFGQLSEDLGGFREKIRPGAFRRTLQAGADVRCLLNHDPSLLLGRSTAGTLRLNEDSRGLHYEVDLPDTQVGRDLFTSVSRGDITQSSFGFKCVSDTWPSRDMRELVDVDLFDVSPVTYPAYRNTAVGVRGQLGWYMGGITVPTVEPSADDRERLQLMLKLAMMLK